MVTTPILRMACLRIALFDGSESSQTIRLNLREFGQVIVRDYLYDSPDRISDLALLFYTYNGWLHPKYELPRMAKRSRSM